jgi:RimJ/RimL family protein N-acetyltransferase
VLPFAPALPLETERLRLRAFTLDDVDATHAVYSRPEVVRWLYHEPWTPAVAAEKVAARLPWVQLAADGSPLFLAVEEKEHGTFLGDCMLRVANVEHREGEIGFVLHPDHQGRGYATEAARELVRVAFDEAGLHRVIARCELRNDASLRVMERLGMRREACFVENEWVKGEWQSELVYALLEREWSDSAPA